MIDGAISLLAILGAILAVVVIAWPPKADVVPMRRRKRIDTYFRSSLERSGPRAEAGLKAHSDALTGKHHGREIKPATLRPVLLSRRSNGGAYVK